MQLETLTIAPEVPEVPRNACPPRPLVAHDPSMLRLLDQADRLATSRATVLIEGESGTGKELIARRIHQRGPRRYGPFVAVNCAGLAEGVLESELFGHERGAFTGALNRRSGRFELAHRGTLFLDEVGAAEPRVQLRLLRVLQEQEFERVGGNQTVRIDARVIAATNADLQEEVGAGRFRADLFYRLSVVPIEVPPLRARPRDIAPLAEHFARRSAERNERPVAGIASEAMARLLAYPWPGNVRQLEHAVEHMVVVGRQEWLQPEDLPRRILEWQADEEALESGAPSYRQARARFERHTLCESLNRNHGVITRTADELGMSRKNLYMRMAELKIDYRVYRR